MCRSIRCPGSSSGTFLQRQRVPLLLGKLSQSRPVHTNVVDVLLGLRLLGAHLGIARTHQVLDQNVRCFVLIRVATVVRHFGRGWLCPLPHVGERRAEVVQLTARFGQLVALGALLRLLDVRKTATWRRLPFPLGRLDLQAVARQGVEERREVALVAPPVQRTKTTQPPPWWAVLPGHLLVHRSYKNCAAIGASGPDTMTSSRPVSPGAHPPP